MKIKNELNEPKNNLEIYLLNIIYFIVPEYFNILT